MGLQRDHRELWCQCHCHAATLHPPARRHPLRSPPAYRETGIDAITAVRDEFNANIPALLITGDTSPSGSPA